MVGDPNTNREGSDRDGNQNARPVRDHSNIGQVRVDKLPASEGIGKLRANYFLCALADRKMKQSFVYDAFLIVRRASMDPEYCSELELTCGGFNRKRNPGGDHLTSGYSRRGRFARSGRTNPHAVKRSLNSRA